MRYESQETERRRRRLDRISLIVLIFLGISLLGYAIALQKLEIAASMQEYERLSQQVQPTESSSDDPPEQTMYFSQPDQTDIPDQQAEDGAGQPTNETKKESSLKPVFVLPDLPTATVVPIHEITAESQPTATKPADSTTGSTKKPEVTEQQPDPTKPPATGKTGADLAACKAANGDFIAWLKIPDTKINYPVVLTDNVDYYLRTPPKLRSQTDEIEHGFR